MKRVIFQEARTYREWRDWQCGLRCLLTACRRSLCRQGDFPTAVLVAAVHHLASLLLACFTQPIAGIDSTRHNYLLLGLALFQFPLNAWLARVPPLPAAAAATVKAAVNQVVEQPLML